MAKVVKKPKPRRKKNWKLVLIPLILLIAVIIALYYFQTPISEEISSEDALKLLNKKIEKCGTNFEEASKVSLTIEDFLFNFLKKTCDGIENYIKPNKSAELWQATKVWKKEPENCDISLPNCKVYYLFGLVGAKGEFSCAYIQVGSKRFEIEDVCGLEVGVNFILKDSYKQGEEIEFKIVNNLEYPIYLDYYDWDERFLYFYKNGEWIEQEIKVYCPCPCDCLQCPTCPAKAKLCNQIQPSSIFTYTWDQKTYEATTINCTSGNRTYTKNCDAEKMAEPGKYKAMFCYTTSYKGSLQYGCEVTGKVRCIEREFEIK